MRLNTLLNEMMPYTRFSSQSNRIWYNVKTGEAFSANDDGSHSLAVLKHPEMFGIDDDQLRANGFEPGTKINDYDGRVLFTAMRHGWVRIYLDYRNPDNNSNIEGTRIDWIHAAALWLAEGMFRSPPMRIILSHRRSGTSETAMVYPLNRQEWEVFLQTGKAQHVKPITTTVTEDIAGAGFAPEAAQAPKPVKKRATKAPAGRTEPETPMVAVNSPAFKQWFGNSKVVGSDGKPLVCVHATAAEFGSAFEIGKQRFGKGGYGFYFTTAQGANRYSDYHDKFMSTYLAGGKIKAPNQIPVFLKMENPLIVKNIEDLKRYLEQGQTFGAERGQWNNIGPDVLSAIEKKGYDGVITWETLAPKVTKRNGLAHKEPGDPKGVRHPVFIVYRPDQIKSIFNKGAFDPKNPDISETA